MTREEMINLGEMFLEANPASKSTETYKFVEKALELAKQEPCDDCWSKKEVVDIINRQRFGINKISMGIIKEKLEALPSVTPTHIETVTEFADRCRECGNRYGRKIKELEKSMGKLQEIEQIIKNHDNDSMPEDYFYIDKIRGVVEE